jgi:UDPglucose 6-dehydrogenase
MKVCVIGSGYVGLVAGAGFAEIGHDVICADISEQKIADLKNGIIPIYEPGLDVLCARNASAGRLHFSTDIPAGIRASDIVFIAVGTPEREDGSADLSAVLQVAGLIASNIAKYTVVACKSTVPVGTNALVTEKIASLTDVPFAVVSNPEFLREGEAVQDFMNPPRVVIGTTDRRAEEMMRSLYAPLYGYYEARRNIICMDPRSAEMTKYTANAFLATRITFINEIANLCEAVGADVTAVRVGAGMDPRIGMQFFQPGCGYGGSCFPKDVQALIKTAREHTCPLDLLQAVDDTNDRQKLIPLNKVRARFRGGLEGVKVAVWGLAFKAETDDVRESPANYIVPALIEDGADVCVHDPIAMESFRRLVESRCRFAPTARDALAGAQALILVTDWQEYREWRLSDIRDAMVGRVVVDGRNVWASQEIPEGLDYDGIGRGTIHR